MAKEGRKLKEDLIAQCKSILLNKLEIIDKELKFLSQAIEEDTKSSAGDKYETGREMANLEKGKLQSQTLSFNKSLVSLNAISLEPGNSIDFGSLVQTNCNLIFISISLGEVVIGNTAILVISPIAPLAQSLLNKRIGDVVSFNKKDMIIDSID